MSMFSSLGGSKMSGGGNAMSFLAAKSPSFPTPDFMFSPQFASASYLPSMTASKSAAPSYLAGLNATKSAIPSSLPGLSLSPLFVDEGIDSSRRRKFNTEEFAQQRPGLGGGNPSMGTTNDRYKNAYSRGMRSKLSLL